MKLKLKIAGKSVELTVVQARRLFDELAEVFDPQIVIEPFWVNPNLPPEPEYPLEGPTCGGFSKS